MPSHSKMLFSNNIFGEGAKMAAPMKISWSSSFKVLKLLLKMENIRCVLPSDHTPHHCYQPPLGHETCPSTPNETFVGSILEGWSTCRKSRNKYLGGNIRLLLISKHQESIKWYVKELPTLMQDQTTKAGRYCTMWQIEWHALCLCLLPIRKNLQWRPLIKRYTSDELQVAETVTHTHHAKA